MKSESTQKKKRKLSNQQILIEKFIEESSFSNRSFWPKEVKIASILIKKYDLDFLLWVIPPYNKKIPSLAYFIADYGQQYLSEQFFNYQKAKTDLTVKIEHIPLSQDKIGEDIVIEKRPKTLKEFLNLYK